MVVNWSPVARKLLLWLVSSSPQLCITRGGPKQVVTSSWITRAGRIKLVRSSQLNRANSWLDRETRGFYVVIFMPRDLRVRCEECELASGSRWARMLLFISWQYYCNTLILLVKPGFGVNQIHTSGPSSFTTSHESFKSATRAPRM